MFKVMLISLREHEVSAVFRHDESSSARPSKAERKGKFCQIIIVQLYHTDVLFKGALLRVVSQRKTKKRINGNRAS